MEFQKRSLFRVQNINYNRNSIRIQSSTYSFKSNQMSVEESKLTTTKDIMDKEDMTKKKRLEDLKKLKEKFSKGNELQVLLKSQCHNITAKQSSWKQGD